MSCNFRQPNLKNEKDKKDNFLLISGPNKDFHYAVCVKFFHWKHNTVWNAISFRGAFKFINGCYVRHRLPFLYLAQEYDGNYLRSGRFPHWREAEKAVTSFTSKFVLLLMTEKEWGTDWVQL